jgi:hypothetical protein
MRNGGVGVNSVLRLFDSVVEMLYRYVANRFLGGLEVWGDQCVSVIEDSECGNSTTFFT